MLRLLLAVIFALLSPAVPEAADTRFIVVMPSLPEPPTDVIDIEIVGKINDEMRGLVASQAASVQARQAKSVHVFIDSSGGSIPDGFEIITALRKTGVPVVCEVGNEAQSMAAVIFQSAACGKRVVQPHSILMFHEARQRLDEAILQQRDLESFADSLKAYSRAMSAVVAPRLGMGVDEYEARIKGGEWYVAGVDAVAQGAADEVRN